jgi:hypothetical protein
MVETSSPEELTELHRSQWSERAATVGRSFNVSPCSYTSDELCALHAGGRRVGFLPAEVADQRKRYLLGRIFPLMHSFGLLEHNVVSNDTYYAGWFDYEVSVDCPYAGKDERELLACVATDRRVLLNLNQYIVASQDNYWLTNRYLDEIHTWARIGSRVGSRMISARFDGKEMSRGMGDEQPLEGCLLLGYDLGAEDCGPTTGGRTYGVSHSDRTGAKRTRVAVSVAPPAPKVRTTDPRQLDLDAEWSSSVAHFLRVGFHTELGLTEEEYVASLPPIGPIPEEYVGRFSVPLVVETRLGWPQQCALAGVNISGYLRVLGFNDPVPASLASTVPHDPYSGWFCGWDERFPDPIAPSDAREQLASDELGANCHEAVTLTLVRPELNLTGHFIDAIGYIFPPVAIGELASASAIERTPGIVRWRNRPEFGCNLHPTEFPHFRPLVRGRQIVTKPLAEER